MKTINIINFYASDLKSISEGGIASYVREILKQCDARISYSLVGVTKNFHNRVGEWGISEFENRKFSFFPILSTRGDHLTYKKGLPLNAQYLIKLFKYKSEIIKKADSLHFHRVELALPFVLFRRHKVPIVVTIHGNNFALDFFQRHALYNKKWFRYIFHEVEKFVIRRADKIIFVSHEALNIYSNIYKRMKEKFIFLPTFVDMETFKPLEKEKCRQGLGIESGKKILLFAGRFDELKNLDLLLDAYVLCLKESKYNLVLLMVGDGVEKERLYKRVTDEKIKDVKFLGNTPHSYLPNIINCADAFVLTSNSEGMPIVLIEALACGIPTVATKVGHIPEIIKNGLNGYIADNGSPELIKEAVFNTLDIKNDIRMMCRKSVLAFSSRAIVDKIENIHSSLLDKNVDKIRIGFDATSLCRKITGIEAYALSLLQHLLQTDTHNEYVVFFLNKLPFSLRNLKTKAKFIKCPIDNQIFCEQIWLPFVINREKVDIMHFPAFPPGIFINRKFIFTIHDATIWKHPKMLSWKGRFYFRPLTILGAKRAQKIITVSESSQKDIIKYSHRKKEDIVISWESISSIFGAKITEKKLQEIKGKYSLPDKFILSVNSIEPRKNICMLLEAYKRFKERNKNSPYKLALVGRRAWGNDTVTKKIKELGLSKEVILTDYVPSEDLVAIYKLADIFVYPSLYEGFGLPPLEAMACGVPVIASDIPSLTEILDDTAVFVDPYSPNKISMAIQELISHPEEKEILSKKGLVRCKEFSWDRVVEKTVLAYRLTVLNPKVNLLGVMINRITMDDTLTRIEQFIENSACAYITTPNVDHMILLQKDEELTKIYQKASLVIPDGVPLIWAAKFLGTPLKEKVSGSDLLPIFCALAAQKEYKLFFLGGREGAVDKAAKALQSKYPNLKVVGTYCPPFGFEKDSRENNKIIQMIKEVKPDILFVGLGTPKQEKWIYKFKDQYQAPVSIGIGASFDFVSGIVKRAPLWMQRIGLEWLWRIMMEPKRLWKRYLVDDMKFFWLVLKQKMSLRK